jgi:hypothetical protein
VDSSQPGTAAGSSTMVPILPRGAEELKSYVVTTE